MSRATQLTAAIEQKSFRKQLTTWDREVRQIQGHTVNTFDEGFPPMSYSLNLTKL